MECVCKICFVHWNMFIKKERKKKNLSLLTIYFLVTAFWDLELDKQMDFTEGIRRRARVCVYIS
jgi:hypothetical protein